MAKAEHDAGGMKVSFLGILSVSPHSSHSLVPDPSLNFPLPDSFSQDAFDKLTVDNANQQASAVAAAVTAADQKASFGDQMAKATLDASDQKAQFEGQMAEAKLAAGDMKSAFDKLTLDNTDQIAAFDSHMAQAEHDAARQQAGFDIRMAKAAHDAGGMKVWDKHSIYGYALSL